MTIIERVIRLLMSQGWFREPTSGFFANNRLSNLIKKDQLGYHLATYMFVQLFVWRKQHYDTIELGMIFSTRSLLRSLKCSIIRTRSSGKTPIPFILPFSCHTRLTCPSSERMAGSPKTLRKLSNLGWRKAKSITNA